ncbi:MAG: Holliday junction branch migration protein RuvA [Oscillospiraceae bacterium]|nr:Holliday junction branch migration protein RuvA [Oscillospiraceae bacterium]
MIYSLTGEIIEKTPSEVVISCGGVGYLVNVPITASGAIPAVGSVGTIYTYLNVREDGLDLFGFADLESKRMFQLLISVSGVGPKVGLALLSALSVQRIALAISAGDFKTLTAANGVGPKVAQRMVLELKDKVGMQQAAGVTMRDVTTGAQSAGSTAQAIAALSSLGYSQSEAAMAIAKLDQSLSVEEMIRLALRGMAK